MARLGKSDFSLFREPVRKEEITRLNVGLGNLVCLVLALLIGLPPKGYFLLFMSLDCKIAILQVHVACWL